MIRRHTAQGQAAQLGHQQATQGTTVAHTIVRAELVRVRINLSDLNGALTLIPVRFQH